MFRWLVLIIFFEVYSFLDCFYNKPKLVTVNNNHVFSFILQDYSDFTKKLFLTTIQTYNVETVEHH